MAVENWCSLLSLRLFGRVSSVIRTGAIGTDSGCCDRYDWRMLLYFYIMGVFTADGKILIVVL